jgi:predicted permease
MHQDIQYAFRSLVKSPGFTAIAVLSLAVGIGANTAIFNLWYGVLHSPLPGVEKPEQLAILTDPNSSGMWRGRWNSAIDGPRGWLTVEEFEQLRDHARSFSWVMAAQSSLNTIGIRVEGGTWEEARWRLVSGNYFQTLGVGPAIGRLFTAADDRAELPYVVISHAYWQRRFGGRADVMGTTFTIGQTPLTIVGVAASNFIGETSGQQPDFWVPLRLQPTVLRGRNRLHDTPPDKTMWLHVFGRLRPGVTLTQADVEANTIFRAGLEGFYGAGDSPAQRRELLDQHLTVQSGARGASPSRTEFSQSLTALLMAVGVILLIACANLANLLLARGTTRRVEIALRLSLGATRAAVIRQLVTESALIAVLGAIASVSIAYVLHRVLVLMLATADPVFAIPFVVNGTTVAFIVLVTLMTALVVGTVPAWQTSSLTPAQVLRTERIGISGTTGQIRSGRLLVAAQLALSLPLLVGAGLLVRTVDNLQQMDLGFSSDSMFLFRVDLQSTSPDVIRRSQTIRELLEALRRTPGVQTISYSSLGLFQGGNSYDFLEVEGYQPKNERDRGANVDVVGPGYFSTLGIPIVQGRELLPSDADTPRRTCVINQAFARQFFNQRNALGLHLTAVDDDKSRQSCEVVGIAGDAQTQNLRAAVEPRYFVVAPLGSPTFLIRARTSPTQLTVELRAAVQRYGAALQVLEATSLDEQMAPLTAQDRATARLALVFGIVALWLAAMGLYGMLSYGISRRRPEIAVRIALGAQPRRVVSMILKEAIALVALGLLAGGGLAYASSRLLASRLYGVAPQDLLTTAFAAGVLVVVAFCASYIPAARASKQDPLTALR